MVCSYLQFAAEKDVMTPDPLAHVLGELCPITILAGELLQLAMGKRGSEEPVL